MAYGKLKSLYRFSKPYNLFLPAATLFFILYIFNTTSHFYIHLRDTYYVISSKHFILLPAIIMLLFWLLYVLTSKILFSKVLSLLHIIITTVTLGLLFIASFLKMHADTGLAGMPRYYYDYGKWNGLLNVDWFSIMMVICFISLIISQLAFVINFSAGLFKKYSR